MTSVARWRSLLLGICIGLVGVAFVPVAQAAPGAVTVDDIAAALGVRRESATYVVAIDISASMKQGGRYVRVRTALSSLLATLRDDDQLTLVTFDGAATVRWRGPVGDRAAQVLAALPATPEGTQTDIGAGIAAAVKELESLPAGRAASVVLITDGRIDAQPDSPYRTADAPGWQQLRTRAEKLSTGRSVAAYAIGLVSDTDADLLGRVFPSTADVPADRVQQHLASIDAALLRFRVAEAVRADVQLGVDVAIEGPLTNLVPGAEPARATLTLTNRSKAVPLQLTQLGLKSEGVPLLVSGLPTGEVVVAAGQTLTLPITIGVPQQATAPARGTVTATATIDSPWRQVITADLKVPFEPRLDGVTPTATVASTPATAIPVPRAPSWAASAGLGLAAAAALVGLLALVVRSSRPVMSGSLTVVRDGRIVTEALLEGRTAWIGAGSGAERVVASVRGRRTRRGEPSAVAVRLRSGGASHSATLVDGQSATLGGLTVSYADQRSRMLDLVNV